MSLVLTVHGAGVIVVVQVLSAVPVVSGVRVRSNVNRDRVVPSRRCAPDVIAAVATNASAARRCRDCRRIVGVVDVTFDVGGSICGVPTAR